MAVAQDVFRRLVKDEIAPALRRLGFKGSGQRFELPSETHIAILGIQKSTSSTADVVRFTANLTVGVREEWERERKQQRLPEETPSPNTVYMLDSLWQERIGALIPGAGGDRWWEIRARADNADVAADFVAAVRDYALPELRRRITSAAHASPSHADSHRP
jgi:hypothetical protein